MQSVRLALIVTTVLAFAACGEREATPPGTAPPDTTQADTTQADTTPEAASGDLTWTTADGNRIVYDVAGSGDVTVLLVHCWMCNRSFWDAQVPVLEKVYRTIRLDLPGHGDATDDRAAWHVETYGQDVAGFMEGLDLRNVILVGHSMGGPVSLRAAALTGDRVRGIVAVDTLHDAEFRFPEEQLDAFVAAFENDYPATCKDFVKQMFPEPGAEAAMQEVQAASCDAQRAPVGIALMKDFGTIDMSQWFSEAGVPIRAINAAEPNPTRIEANRNYADFDAVLMEGVGHYPHMSRPDAFNPLLLNAIRDLAGETG